MRSSAPTSIDQSRHESDRLRQRTAGWLSLGSGTAFVLTVVYLFAVMPATGWSIAMFDSPEELLVWINAHERVYQGLWLIYFVSQMLLLAVPALLSVPGARVAAVFGTAAVVIAMVGLALIFAVSPVIAHAYAASTAAGSSSSVANVLVLHDVTADMGKVLRLFSELLLGVWLILVGRQMRDTFLQRRWWGLGVLGCWTIGVAGTKLFQPTIALEDWLGFLLGVSYIVLGIGLLGHGPPPHPAP